jgi:CheY-like chemotaxis protein
VVEETRPVTKTLLAVDDSATMRKVLEITFSGDDFRVVTADGPQAALAKLNEEPSVFLIDTILGKDDGYALCAEIRRRDPKATILLLASRHNPYDQARGKDAGADDFVDKPFDTQQIIDKVKKTMGGRDAGAGAAAAAPAPQAAAGPPPSVQRPPQAPPGPPPSAPGARQPGARPPVTPERARARTLMFGDAGGAPADDAKVASPQPPAVAPAGTAGHTKPSAAVYPGSRTQPGPGAAKPAAPAPAPTPKPATPQASPKPPAVAAQRPAAQAAVASSVNGHLAGKLGELGLSAQQIDAVMALSREVVEQVVWEVVPQLAETLIKEEIARLTKEG